MGGKKELNLKNKGGGTTDFLYIGRMPVQNGFRVTSDHLEIACAVIAPVFAKAANTPDDVDHFDLSHGHAHVVLLKKTAKQQAKTLEGALR